MRDEQCPMCVVDLPRVRQGVPGNLLFSGDQH